MENDNERGFGTYEDLGNGYTRDGDVAGDYLEAGRDPKLPRLSAKLIADRLVELTHEQQSSTVVAAGDEVGGSGKAGDRG